MRERAQKWLKANFELGSGQNRLIPMEGLRGFAVSLVFLQHYTTQNLVLLHPTGGTQTLALAFKNYGNLGVELFFVLSGYLIYGALLRRPSFGRFMARRVRRIYPAFLVAFGIALALSLTTPAASKIPAGSDGALYIVENLMLLPGLFAIEPLMSVAWSLSYEMFFYLATAAVVVALALDRLGKSGRIALIFTLAAALTIADFMNPGSAPIRMAPFFAGMLLVELGEGFGVPGWLGLGAPIAAFLATIVFHVPLPAPAAEWLHTIAFMLLCAACFRGGNSAAALFAWAPMRWLGNMSYSYYLIHGFVVKAAVEVVARVIGPVAPNGEFWLLLLPVFAMSLFPAAALFIGIEKPFSLQPANSRDRVASVAA
jgi:exopolysaccharide production protein ExoZ